MIRGHNFNKEELDKEYVKMVNGDENNYWLKLGRAVFDSGISEPPEIEFSK